MRGLSEEDIKRFIRAHNVDNEHNWIAGLLLEECHELDPWLPIESAPKDRPVWLYNGIKVIGQWDICNLKWFVNPIFWNGITYKDNLPFTHYKELPEDPTCENSADT